MWRWNLESDNGYGTKYYQVLYGRKVVDAAVMIYNAGLSWYNGDGNPYASEDLAKTAWQEAHPQ